MWITSLVNKPSLIVRSLGSEHSECAAWLHPRVCGEVLPEDGRDSRGKVFLDQCRPSFGGSLTRWPGLLMDLPSWRQLIWCLSILPFFPPAFLSPWLPGFQCYHGVSWTGSRRPVSPGNVRMVSLSLPRLFLPSVCISLILWCPLFVFAHFGDWSTFKISGGS